MFQIIDNERGTFTANLIEILTHFSAFLAIFLANLEKKQ